MASSNYSIIFVNTRSQNKTVTLPAASNAPGRVVYIKDICGNSAVSTLQIQCATGDFIDKRPHTSTVLMSTKASTVKLASDGLNNWMILAYYNNGFGQPGPAPPPPPGRVWSSNVDGADASVVNNGGGSYTCNGPDDGGGDGFAYIYSLFTSAGSFTYNYNWSTVDGIDFDWPFEYVTANDPSDRNNVDFNTKIASGNTETGTRTVSYGANQYVVLGVYSVDSAVGNGVCTFSSLPTS